MDYGTNTPFIIASYAVSFIGILGLVIWAIRKPKL
jgi:hypothetical protein